MASYNIKPMMNGKPGIAVVAKRGEGFEGLMRRFKRSVSKNGVMKDLQSKQYFEKPCQRRKRKKAESIKRTNKKESDNGRDSSGQRQSNC